MPKLKQTLFIARSQESAQLYLDTHSGAIRAVTLPALLSEFAPDADVIDSFVARLLLKEVIGGLALQHFAYLSEAPESLSALETHLRSIRLNGVGLDAFGYSAQKRKELETILEAYKDRKAALQVHDAADATLAAVQKMEVSTAWFARFEGVVIDLFEEEGIRFYTNRAEQKALEILRGLDNVLAHGYPKTAMKAPASFTLQHTRADEALFAIKAARRLMEEGAADTQIAIVVSSLNRYRRAFEERAGEYGMRLRFTSGTPLMADPLFALYLKKGLGGFEHFRAFVDDMVKSRRIQGELDDEATEGIGRTFRTIKSLHDKALGIIEKAKALGLTPPLMKEVILSLAEERFVPPSFEQSGITVTEPNQMTQRSFEHVIFIGTDLVLFPPKSGGDYLSSARQREELLFFNNSYALSEYYYRRMLRDNGALHLCQAEFDGKRKLTLSPIVDAGGCKPFDVSGIKGERDCLRRGERFGLDENAEHYIASLVSPEATGFDGTVTRRSFSPGTLSATTLGSYARCPLRYLFEHQYGCEAISAERDEEALEASDIGTMFHSIAERFANAVKRGDIILPETLDDTVKQQIESIAKSVFDAYMKKNFTDLDRPITLVHRIAYNDLLKGLYKEHHQKGLLIRFLECIYDEGSLEHFYKSEQPFMLDSDFKITNDKSKAFVKGFIDRIDKDDVQHALKVIDYKTGKYTKEKANRLLEGMNTFREFQLPLYLLYAKQAFADYALEAFLVSFRNGDGVKAYGNIGTEGGEVEFDDAFEAGLKTAIEAINDSIENGRFAMTPSEENCAYCEFERICHKSVLPHKEALNEV
jgi:CRISPR/Cas system-associated exonuclease Cas4 (RecB family)